MTKTISYFPKSKGELGNRKKGSGGDGITGKTNKYQKPFSFLISCSPIATFISDYFQYSFVAKKALVDGQICDFAGFLVTQVKRKYDQTYAKTIPK